jgi:hypothetical protein
MDALSVILTDEQIATLNKPETLAKVKEVSGVKAELEAYWKRLFAHLRTFQAPAQSVAGEGARSGDLSAEDMGAMPEILTDEQIATLNKPETLAKVKEASRVKAELDSYWKRLFDHLRTFQFSAQSVAGEGARSGDLSAEDMGAMPEFLTDEQIATLNKPETLAKVKEVFAARSRVTNPHLKAVLKAYWKRLFAHLRTFQPWEVRRD